MRIGEIAVISPPGEIKEIFIRSVCQKLQKANNKICFGRLKINDQLILHLYGISVDKEDSSIAWDLISPKILGYIVIFNWEDQSSLEEIKNILDFFSTNFSAPIIVVANVADESNIPVPNKFLESNGILIAQNTRFIFCQISNPIYSKKVVATVIDILLDNLA